MPGLIPRRCSINPQTQKTFYEGVLEDAIGLGDTNLASHQFGVTFKRGDADGMGNFAYVKMDGTPLRVNLVAEIGSEEEGTYMASYPQKLAPAHKLPYDDWGLKSHKMTLALRVPTAAPKELADMFRNSLAACDGVRAADEAEELAANERFEINDWIACAAGDEANVEKMRLHVKLQNTYDILAPATPSTPTAGTPGRNSTRVARGRVTRADDNAPAPAATSTAPVDAALLMTPPPADEREIGDKYHVDCYSDHRGSAVFAQIKSACTQRDYRDFDNTLIAPPETYEKLVEGTLALFGLSFTTYVITAKFTDSGAPLPPRKVYHAIVEQLRILDVGDGAAWAPDVPSIPEPRSFPSTPTKRARDPVADTSGKCFRSGASGTRAAREAIKPECLLAPAQHYRRQNTFWCQNVPD